MWLSEGVVNCVVTARDRTFARCTSTLLCANPHCMLTSVLDGFASQAHMKRLKNPSLILYHLVGRPCTTTTPADTSSCLVHSIIQRLCREEAFATTSRRVGSIKLAKRVDRAATTLRRLKDGVFGYSLELDDAFDPLSRCFILMTYHVTPVGTSPSASPPQAVSRHYNVCLATRECSCGANTSYCPHMLAVENSTVAATLTRLWGYDVVHGALIRSRLADFGVHTAQVALSAAALMRVPPQPRVRQPVVRGVDVPDIVMMQNAFDRISAAIRSNTFDALPAALQAAARALADPPTGPTVTAASRTHPRTDMSVDFDAVVDPLALLSPHRSGDHEPDLLHPLDITFPALHRSNGQQVQFSNLEPARSTAKLRTPWLPQTGRKVRQRRGSATMGEIEVAVAPPPLDTQEVATLDREAGIMAEGEAWLTAHLPRLASVGLTQAVLASMVPSSSLSYAALCFLIRRLNTDLAAMLTHRPHLNQLNKSHGAAGGLTRMIGADGAQRLGVVGCVCSAMVDTLMGRMPRPLPRTAAAFTAAAQPIANALVDASARGPLAEPIGEPTALVLRSASSFDALLLPVPVGETHYVLLAVDMHDFSLHAFDTLSAVTGAPGSANRTGVTHMAWAVHSLVRAMHVKIMPRASGELFNSALLAREPPMEPREVTFHSTRNQYNFTSGGVFVWDMARHIVAGVPFAHPFSQVREQRLLTLVRVVTREWTWPVQLEDSCVALAPTAHPGALNRSATCYMAAAMALLYTTPGFVDFIELGSNFEEDDIVRSQVRAGSLACSAASMADVLCPAGSPILSILANVRVIGALSGRAPSNYEVAALYVTQQDSHDFMSDLFCRLLSGTRWVRMWPFECHVAELMQLTCEHPKTIVVRDSNSGIVLPYPPSSAGSTGDLSLNALLSAWCDGRWDSENVAGVTCTACSPHSNVKYELKCRLRAPFPRELLITFPRFSRDKFDNVTKCTSKMTVPEDLDMSAYCDCAISAVGTKYQLTGCIVHLGSLNGGHYICFKRIGGTWYLFDDSTEGVVTVAEVTRASSCGGYVYQYTQR